MNNIVKPASDRIESITLEDRLTRKFDDMQRAREGRQDSLFDELNRSIEVLLKAVPEAFEELMYEKQRLNNELEKEKQDIIYKANSARDEISRDVIFQSGVNKANWEYREVYEEVIIEILQKYDLIPMRRPSGSMIRDYQFQSNEKMQSIEQPQQEQIQQQYTPPQEQTEAKQKFKRFGRKQEDVEL